MKDQIILIISYLHGIWRYRWSALVITWVVALTGWAVVYSMPNKYTSNAVMYVDTKSVMQPLLKGLTVESDVDEGLGMMRKILLSRSNLEDVIRETDMDLQVSTPAEMDDMVANLVNSISLKGKDQNRGRSRNTIYELSYEGTSPVLVYQVVSKLMNTLIESTVNSSRTDTESAQSFLNEQIAEYERRLSLAEEKLAQFKRENIGHMPDKTGGFYKRLQNEQNQLKALKSRLRLTQSGLNEMQKQLKGESPILDSNSQHSSKLRAYQEQLQTLLTQFTEQHPDVKALRATIDEYIANGETGSENDVNFDNGLPAEYNPVYQELKADMHRTSVEVETLKSEIENKESDISLLKQSVDIIPEIEAKLSKLNRDYDITRKRYLTLVERRESARLAQEIGMSGNNVDFRVIDSPRIATKPSGPNRLLFLSLVLVVAFGVGLAWGVLRYLIYPTYIDVSQLRDTIGLPVLGSVTLHITPDHKRKRKVQIAGFLLTLSMLIIVFGAIVLFKDSGSDFLNSYLQSRDSF